jgi:5'-3' exonuclease
MYKRTETLGPDVAIAAAQTMLRTTYNEVSQRVGHKPRMSLLLTGYGNYRERMASVIRYKFNRVETQKPKHYGAVRKHLVDELDAEIVNWYEADDRCAILQTADPASVVISSIDKDLLQVAGLHHIPNKGFKQVNTYSGLLRFYQQALQGDSTDGIPGCYRIGPAKAAKVIDEVAAGVDRAAGYTGLERALWPAIVAQYEQALDKYGPAKCGYADAQAAALETARLVYLLRTEPAQPHAPDMWEPTT